MTQVAVGFVLLYAVLVIAGGIVGYAKAKSKASLTSGVGSGVLLLVTWGISLQAPRWGLALAAAIALALLGVFAWRYTRTRKIMPAGVMAGLSLVAAVICVLGWLAIAG